MQAQELRAYLVQRLPHYMVPTFITVLVALPMTPHCKVDRDALQQIDVAPIGDGDDYVAPRNETEARLATTWSEVLGVALVGVYDDFFEKGGNSLLVARMVTRAREQFGVELVPAAQFETATVEKLAHFIEDLQVTVNANSLRSVRNKRLLYGKVLSQKSGRAGTEIVSLSQHGMWYLQQLQPHNRQYNVPFHCRLHGELDSGALQTALQMVVDRHDVLRAAFVIVAHQPAMVVAVELRIEDLTTLPAEEREEVLQRNRLADAQQPFDLTCTPLFRLTLWKMSAQEQCLSVQLPPPRV